MTQTIEQRSLVTEVRMVGTPGAPPKIRGYGIVFNTPSAVLTEPDEAGRERKFRERIMPGAGRRAMADADVRVLAHHDKTQVLGRRSAGTARFGEDSRGIWYEADPPDTSYGRDMVVSLCRGDIDGSSFSFTPVRDEWSAEPDADGVYERTIHELHVFEMGPVSWPAYRAASAQYRDSSPEVLVPLPVLYPTRDQVTLLNQIRLAELG